MFTRALEQDGRLHAYARSLAATTGRMAISGVPLQTAPKEIELDGDLDAKGRLAVRDVLVADAGCVVGSIDYRAMELRLAAGLSGDGALRAVVEAGDPHLEVARALFKRRADIADSAASQRQSTSQRCTGCSRTGSRSGSGSRSGRRSRSSTRGGRASRELQRYAAELSDDDRSPWGRRLPIDARRHAKLNHRIQAAGRDIFCAGLLRLEDAGLVDHLVLPLHDEYVLTVPEDEAHELVARAAAIVEQRARRGSAPRRRERRRALLGVGEVTCVTLAWKRGQPLQPAHAAGRRRATGPAGRRSPGKQNTRCPHQAARVGAHCESYPSFVARDRGQRFAAVALALPLRCRLRAPLPGRESRQLERGRRSGGALRVRRARVPDSPAARLGSAVCARGAGRLRCPVVDAGADTAAPRNRST